MTQVRPAAGVAGHSDQQDAEQTQTLEFVGLCLRRVLLIAARIAGGSHSSVTM
jgi:hypothetical protein